MHDQDLIRYSRHLMLPEVDYAGQEKLQAARVLLVGLGGLGSPAAMYLASSGVGHLVINDFDEVDLANLQRQIAYTTHDLGKRKATAARATLRAINPNITIDAVTERLSDEGLYEQVDRADAVVDGSDNFDTRFALNRVCVATRTPLVSGSAIRLQGQVMVHDPTQPDCPCYNCLYPDIQTRELATCSENGILAPVVGIVASIQATETLKLLIGLGTSLAGRVVQINAKNMEIRTTTALRDPDCPTCGTWPRRSLNKR